MFLLIFTREQGISDGEFIEDASKGPHINCRVVGNAQNDLRRSVKPGLDVSVDLLVLEAAAAEVDYLDA